MKTVTDGDLLAKITEGFRRVGLTFPYLVGLIQKIRIRLDHRVPTMGIFASGRLAVNPDFLRSLNAPDLLFVLTHELFHLTLRTHERAEGADPVAFNYAHDFIINDILREELQVERIPAGGLDRRGARHMSAEKLMGEMERDPRSRMGGSWDELMDGDGDGNGPGLALDVLDSDLERQLFPETTARDQQAQAREVQGQATRALSLQALLESLRGKGTEAGGQEETVAALRGLYRPPWELALQRWMEAAAPSERSYARPSRRGAERTDVVLPGRKREGWTLHIVLDTSGSMIDEVPRALGAIADFAEAMSVEQVHLIQCDTAVGSDEILSPAEIHQWRVTGFGGSDLTPAMLRLAENPEVAAALVLTDGEIEYPEQPLPYQVLWVLPPWKSPQEFNPRYGKVLQMTHG